jgi:hypothetical protein
LLHVAIIAGLIGLGLVLHCLHRLFPMGNRCFHHRVWLDDMLH